jgi:hypothetical protein
MDELKITPHSLAFLFSFLIIPKFTVIFINMLSADNGGWLWSYDPVIIIGYVNLVLLYLLFWLKERTSPNITASIPVAVIHASLAVLILVPALAALAFSVVSLRPFLSFLIQILVWIILVLVVFGLPYFSIRGDFSNKQKTLTVLTGAAFLISPSYGPIFRIFGLARTMIESGYFKLLKGIDIGLIILYFILVVLLYISETEVKGRFAFTAFCTGLTLMTYGLGNPVNYGSKASSKLLTTYIGNTPISLTVVRIINFNWVLIVGLLLLVFLYLTLYSSKTAGKQGTFSA